MENRLFISKGDAGVALIAVLLTITLITALFVMAFTNSIIGKSVTQAHINRRADAQCAQGAIEITYEIFNQRDAVQPQYAFGATNASFTGAVNDDSVVFPVNGDPDVIIPAGAVAGCLQTHVDIDYLFHDKDPGTAEDYMAGYDPLTGGTFCGAGYFYSVTAAVQRGGPSGAMSYIVYRCKQ